MFIIFNIILIIYDFMIYFLNFKILSKCNKYNVFFAVYNIEYLDLPLEACHPEFQGWGTFHANQLKGRALRRVGDMHPLALELEEN